MDLNPQPQQQLSYAAATFPKLQIWKENIIRASLVNLKLITIENSKSLKRHAFLETLRKKLNTEPNYYKHVLSFNILGFANEAALV